MIVPCLYKIGLNILVGYGILTLRKRGVNEPDTLRLFGRSAFDAQGRGSRAQRGPGLQESALEMRCMVES